MEDDPEPPLAPPAEPSGLGTKGTKRPGREDRAGASGQRVAGKSADELQRALHDEVTRLGGDPSGWTCVVKPRGGDWAKGSDPYYLSPEQKRFRSRQEVLRTLGLAGKPRAEAAARAGVWAAAHRPPLALTAHLSVTALGVVDPRLAFHDRTHICPLGYTAVWADAATGLSYSFELTADPLLQRPLYRITLASSAAAGAAAGAQPVLGAFAAALAAKKGLAQPAAAAETAELSVPAAPSPPPAPSGPVVIEALSLEEAWAVALAVQPPPGGVTELPGCGLDHPTVQRALEGLPRAAELCRDYVLVEQTGDWEVETAARLRRAAMEEPKRRARLAGPTAEGHAGRRLAAAAEALALERRKVGGMGEAARVEYERVRRETALAGAPEERPARVERGGKADNKSAAKAVTARQRAAARETAVVERDSASAARSRRAKYPLPDDEAAAAEVADAIAEHRPPPVRPPRPPLQPQPGYTGSALVLAAFLEERRLLGLVAGPSPALLPADVAVGLRPEHIVAALGDPAGPVGAPLLSELYSVLLRVLVTPAAWAHAEAAPGGIRPLQPPPIWAKIATRAGFAAWPELLRRWAGFGCKARDWPPNLYAAAAACAAQGLGACDGAGHAELLMQLLSDAIDTPAVRKALDKSADAREELKKAHRLELNAARAAHREAREGVIEAQRRCDVIADAIGAPRESLQGTAPAPAPVSAPALAPAAAADAAPAAMDTDAPAAPEAAAEEEEEYSEFRDAGAGEDSDSDFGPAAKRAKGIAASRVGMLGGRWPAPPSTAGLAAARSMLAQAHAAAAAAQAAEDAVEAKLAKELSAHLIRATQLGSDRELNRYWWSPREPSSVYCEAAPATPPEWRAAHGCPHPVLGPDSQEVPSEAPPPAWGRYTSGAEIAGLLAALSPCGTREAALREAVRRLVVPPSAEGDAMQMDPPPPPSAPCFEAAAVAVAAADALSLMEPCLVNKAPDLGAELPEFMRTLRSYLAPAAAPSGAAWDVAVADFATQFLLFEETLCRVVDPRAAGLSKSAQRAAEVAARRAAAAAAAAAAGEAPPAAEEEEEEAAVAEVDEAESEVFEAQLVDSKPSGGAGKPPHPPLWRQIHIRHAWRRQLARCAAPGAAQPAAALAYAVASLAERAVASMTSLCGKVVFPKRPAQPPLRYPAPRRPRNPGAAGAEIEAAEREAAALEADAAAVARWRDAGGVARDIEEADIPKCLQRSVLEALCKKHTGRDVSRQKLAKFKVARLLPPEVLKEAMDGALARKAAGVDGAGAAEAPPAEAPAGGRKGKKPEAEEGEEEEEGPMDDGEFKP